MISSWNLEEGGEKGGARAASPLLNFKFICSKPKLDVAYLNLCERTKARCLKGFVDLSQIL